MIATHSPCSIVQRDPAQRVDLHLAHLVDLGDVLDLNHMLISPHANMPPRSRPRILTSES